jgi:hypothetical protein
MDRTRRSATTGLGVLLACAATLLPVTPTSASAAVSTAAAHSQAAAINLQAADFPAGTSWTSSPSTPNTASQNRLAKQALTCIKRGGGTARKISSDPFDLAGSTSAAGTADIQSPMFSERSSTTGLPGMQSDVVVVTTNRQAINDLASFALKKTFACATRFELAIVEGAADTKLKSSSKLRHPAHFGHGNGGIEYSIKFTGGGLGVALFTDAYFYVQGNAEVSFSFANLGSPFPAAWAGAVITSVMTRAQSVKS